MILQRCPGFGLNYREKVVHVEKIFEFRPLRIV